MHPHGRVETGVLSPVLDPQPTRCVCGDDRPPLEPETTTHPILKAIRQSSLPSIPMETSDSGGKLSDKGKSLEPFKTRSGAYPLPEIRPTAPVELAPGGTSMSTHASVAQQIRMTRIPGTPRSSRHRSGQRNAVSGSETRDTRSRARPFDANCDPARRPHDASVDHQGLWSDSSSERFRQARALEVDDGCCSEGNEGEEATTPPRPRVSERCVGQCIDARS
ncbi:hypothetical protein F1559_005114 [Cyanidiococcus yangmingshanensis]|uniref:Uncharacterized protein n=1 Tax=Cyanidiococcus yangmingshanensis TaxID=2690220 RepID=A0A7J7IRY4_9RHOD|nr:hypothetical protein F1559_005114 [Cyanidiococcus yangmingshanensis]